MTIEGTTVSYFKSCFPNDAAACTVVCVKGAIDEETEAEVKKSLPGLIDQATSIRVFYRPSKNLEGMSMPKCPTFTEPCFLSGMFLKGFDVAFTPIPCSFVATADRDDWDYAICILKM